MFLIIFLILLFSLTLYLLLIPIILNIDTNKNQYYIQLKGLARASFMGDGDELLKIKLQILFMKFDFYPLKKNVNTKKKDKIKSEKPKKRNMPMSMESGLRILKTFKVKKFFLDIDTGDSITNAKLYPCFAFLNYNGGHFKINFEGRNHLVLCIYNRPIFIIKSFINI